MYSRRTIVFTAATIVAVTACGDKKDSETATTTETTTAVTTPAPSSNVLTVHAKNYTFDIPDTIQPGVVTISLVNDGPAPEVHHMNIVRVIGNFTSKDYINELKGGRPPAWAISMGGPNPSTAPGVPSNATMDLKPGRYIALCFVPGADNVPHVLKGMAKDFVVMGKEVPAGGMAAAAAEVSPPPVNAVMPPADVTITLADYSFNVSPALTAGRHTIKVENTAAQDHEVVLVKLDAGKTADDVVKFVETMKGPPPGTFIGGISGMSNGTVNQFDVELTAGDYALICFLPDAKDGKMHAMHGMTQTLHIS